MAYEWQSWDSNPDCTHCLYGELALSSAFNPRSSFRIVCWAFPHGFLVRAQAPHFLPQTTFSFRLSYVHSWSCRSPGHLGSHLWANSDWNWILAPQNSRVSPVRVGQSTLLHSCPSNSVPPCFDFHTPLRCEVHLVFTSACPPVSPCFSSLYTASLNLSS